MKSVELLADKAVNFSTIQTDQIQKRLQIPDAKLNLPLSYQSYRYPTKKIQKLEKLPEAAADALLSTFVICMYQIGEVALSQSHPPAVIILLFTLQCFQMFQLDERYTNYINRHHGRYDQMPHPIPKTKS